MTDIEPLLQSGSNSRLTSLLRAAAQERPSPGLPGRLLVSLGVSATTSALSGVKAAAAMTAPHGAGGTALAPALGILAAKWVAVGLVGGALAAAGLRAVTSTSEPSRTSDHSPRLGTVAVARPPMSAPRPELSANTLPFDPPPVERPRTTLPSASSSTSGLELRRELRRIDAARSALEAGDAPRALEELQAYERLAVTRLLDREARVLRIEALMQAGHVQRARSLAEDYSAEFPQDAHARRLRALTLGGGGSRGSVGDMNRAERSE